MFVIPWHVWDLRKERERNTDIEIRITGRISLFHKNHALFLKHNRELGLVLSS
jgi:hypothetical protein